jgi:hypothetical protein
MSFSFPEKVMYRKFSKPKPLPISITPYSHDPLVVSDGTVPKARPGSMFSGAIGHLQNLSSHPPAAATSAVSASLSSSSKSSAARVPLEGAASLLSSRKSVAVRAPAPSELAARADAPSLNLTTGAKRRLSDSTEPLDRLALLSNLDSDVTARSAKGTKASHMKTWLEFHEAWFGPAVPMMPLTPPIVRAIASQFKDKEYRSFGNYLSTAKQVHVMGGHDWTQQLELVGKRCSASVNRGIGAARQSADIDLVKAQLVSDITCFDQVAPVTSPRCMLTVTSFFLMREIESSLALARNCVLLQASSIVRIKLAATKTDPGAVSEWREWGCVCAGVRTIPCAFHAASDHYVNLTHAFGQPESWDSELPLFPRDNGKPMSKEMVVTVYEFVASATGDVLIDNLGRRRIGGHTARVTGARYLAGLGLEIFKLCVLARWASATVLRYVKSTPLLSITSDVKRLIAGESLHSVVSDLRSELVDVSARAVDPNLAFAIERLNTLEATVESLSADAPRFVINTNTLCIHSVLVCNIETSPDIWVTKCGWVFGRSRYSLCRTIPASHRATSICKCTGSSRSHAYVGDSVVSSSD